MIIKNDGDEELPENCELQLMNEINGLALEKYKTQNSIEDTEEITLKFKVNLESIELNEVIGVKLKLIDDKKNGIGSVKCKKTLKKKKENKKKLPMIKRLIKTLIIIY